MKKLFATLLVGALVSMGCSSSTTSKTPTDHKGGTKMESSTQTSGGAALPTTSSSRMAPESKPAPKGSTKIEESTKSGGKTTSKTAETKK